MFKKIFGISLLFIVGSFVFMNLASAQTINIWKGAYNCREYVGDKCTTYYSGDNTCNVSPGGCSLCNGLQVAVNIVNNLTTLAIAITVGMTVYGAIRLMLSGGSEEMVKNARGIITSAVIGLIVVLCGWLIINTFVHILADPSNPFPWNNVQCKNP